MPRKAAPVHLKLGPPIGGSPSTVFSYGRLLRTSNAISQMDGAEASGFGAVKREPRPAGKPILTALEYGRCIRLASDRREDDQADLVNKTRIQEIAISLRPAFQHQALHTELGSENVERVFQIDAIFLRYDNRPLKACR